MKRLLIYILLLFTAPVYSQVIHDVYVKAPSDGTVVDSIYRTLGKDSIQFKIAGRYHAIKDSTTILRFGLEDNTTSTDRNFNLNFQDFSLYNGTTLYLAIADLSLGGVGSSLLLAGNATKFEQVDNAYTLRHILTKPSDRQGDYYIPLSVNGEVADATGNITISASGSSGISSLGTPAFGLTRTNDSTYIVDTSDVSILSRQRAAATYQLIGNYAIADSTLWQTKFRSDTARSGIYGSLAGKQATGLSWLLASGGTLTGTNTITAGSNPIIFSTGATTGTGATAGIQVAANSLTTGNGVDESSSSLSTGNIHKITSTSTVVNGGSLLNINSSGANSTASKTATGLTISNTNTGTTSTNVGLNVTASGATTNYPALFNGGNVGIGTSAPAYPLHLVGARFFQTGTTGTAATTLYQVVDNTSGTNNSYVLFGVDINGSTVGNGSVAGTYISTGHNGTGTQRQLILHNYDNQAIIFNNNNTERARIDAGGNMGIGVTSPTALLHIKAGTATASTAPLKFTAGTLLTTPESGVLETNSSNELFYSTSTTTASRGYVGVLRYVAKTGAYTATTNDYTIDCTANTFQVTLPTAVGIAGRIYVVTNSDAASTITVGTTSSQTFVNFTATPTTLSIVGLGSRMVQSTGTAWLLLSSL